MAFQEILGFDLTLSALLGTLGTLVWGQSSFQSLAFLGLPQSLNILVSMVWVAALEPGDNSKRNSN